jgi:hypothetical protein
MTVYELQLKHLSEKARPWCNTRLGFPCKAGPSSSDSEGDLAASRSSQGDCVLFNALLAFSGVEEALGYIPACIAEDGRPVRSPDLVLTPPQEDGFSKDMLLGVLLWTLVSRDPAPLERLIGYVNRTGCLCPKSSDRRCTLTPQMTYLTNKVAKHVGSKARLKGAWLPGWLFTTLEVASALVTPLGYQCHLLSVKALICKLLSGDSSNQTVSAILAKRDAGKSLAVVPKVLALRDSQNPWFFWLDGQEEKAALTLLSLNVQPGKGSQWSWERDSAEKAWYDSMGWDMLFLTNLLLRKQD